MGGKEIGRFIVRYTNLNIYVYRYSYAISKNTHTFPRLVSFFLFLVRVFFCVAVLFAQLTRSVWRTRYWHSFPGKLYCRAEQIIGEKSSDFISQCLFLVSQYRFSAIDQFPNGENRIEYIQKSACRDNIYQTIFIACI